MVTSSSKPQSSPGLSSDVIGEQRVLMHPVSWECFELWLVDGVYVEKQESAAFPNLPLTQIFDIY
jgi:hypothetical protein